MNPALKYGALGKYKERFAWLIFSTSQEKNIDEVLEYYGDKNPQWLSTLAQMEEPWKIARIGVAYGSRSHNIVAKEDMAIYYGGL